MYLIGAIGFFATAIGISIGGLLAMFLKGFNQKLATIYALCSGLILGLVCLEIAPESIITGGWFLFILGFLIGVLIFLVMHKASNMVSIITNSPKKDLYIHTGFLLTISISIHNFPMGIAFGSSQNSEVSNSILQTLILHNIPEGIAMFTPLFLAGLSLNALLLFTSIVSLPVGIGAVFGSILGMGHPVIWAFITSLAVGIMVLVTIKEIYAESLKHSSMVYSLVVTCIGVVTIGIYLKLI